MSASDLAAFRTQLDAIRAEAAERFGALTPGQLGWRPDPAAWSAGQVAAHLHATNQQYLPRMRAALEDARRGGRTPRPHRPTLLGGWLARAMRAPRRMPAPRAFRPQQDTGGGWAAAVDGYRATLEGLEAVLAGAEGVDLNSARLASPVSRLVRMNLGDAIAVWLAHDRRHLGQVARLTDHPGFPVG